MLTLHLPFALLFISYCPQESPTTYSEFIRVSVCDSSFCAADSFICARVWRGWKPALPVVCKPCRQKLRSLLISGQHHVDITQSLYTESFVDTLFTYSLILFVFYILTSLMKLFKTSTYICVCFHQFLRAGYILRGFLTPSGYFFF